MSRDSSRRSRSPRRTSHRRDRSRDRSPYRRNTYSNRNHDSYRNRDSAPSAPNSRSIVSINAPEDWKSLIKPETQSTKESNQDSKKESVYVPKKLQETNPIEDMVWDELEFQKRVETQLAKLAEKENEEKRLEERRKRMLQMESMRCDGIGESGNQEAMIVKRKDISDSVVLEIYATVDSVADSKQIISENHDSDQVVLNSKNKESLVGNYEANQLNGWGKMQQSQNKMEKKSDIDQILPALLKNSAAFNMFSDDSPVHVPKAPDVQIISNGIENNLLTDNWDDQEGYYNFRIGDLLNGRFEVFALQGKGVFSSVLRVKDKKENDRECVVKVMRKNDVMYKAGQREVMFLELLAKNDPENKKHCIRLFSYFEHRNHLCLVFEAMAMNLREVMKKYGSGTGLHINAVKNYAYQMFVALSLTRKCKIIHADLKPDNILVCFSLAWYHYYRSVKITEC